MVLTMLSRSAGQGVRVAMKDGAFRPDAEHMALIQKIVRAEATEEERLRFDTLHAAASRDILEMPEEILFTIMPVNQELPATAVIEPSEPCARCGEPTMRSKMKMIDHQKICRGCLTAETTLATQG